MKKILYYIIICASFLVITDIDTAIIAAPAKAPAKTQVKAPIKKEAAKAPSTESTAKQNTVSATVVSPLEVVNNPSKYLNKNITFNANFVSFTTLGLDYKPAFRDSAKYIGILIQREDSKSNVIPLSEMKILVPRENMEKYADLEQGDKIKITGTVFSTALSDPWVDVTKFEVLSQKNKD